MSADKTGPGVAGESMRTPEEAGLVEPTELGTIIELPTGYAIKLSRETPGQWMTYDGWCWNYSAEWWDVVDYLPEPRIGDGGPSNG